MPTYNSAEDIAAILSPLPAFGPDDDPMTVDAVTEQVLAERTDTVQGLEAAWDQDGADLLLDTLAHLRRQRLRLEEQMRLLVAYGRHFTPVRPYRLTELAEAVGMSISGVRTSYDGDELDTVAAILNRPPSPGRTEGNNDRARAQTPAPATQRLPSGD